MSQRTMETIEGLVIGKPVDRPGRYDSIMRCVRALSTSDWTAVTEDDLANFDHPRADREYGRWKAAGTKPSVLSAMEALSSEADEIEMTVTTVVSGADGTCLALNSPKTLRLFPEDVVVIRRAG